MHVTGDARLGIIAARAPQAGTRTSLAGGARAASWALQLLVAGILAQTLAFKFTAAPESVAIFTRLGAEPWGRIAAGAVELVAALLLVVPSTAAIGAIVSLGVISGAIASHLAVLGIAVPDSDGSSDGGLLFALALLVALGSAAILTIRRREIPLLGERLFAGDA